jgi:hypothetical protein
MRSLLTNQVTAVNSRIKSSLLGIANSPASSSAVSSKEGLGPAAEELLLVAIAHRLAGGDQAYSQLTRR